MIGRLIRSDGMTLNEQRVMFFFDATGTTFAPITCDFFWTPLEDIEHREMRKQGVERAVWSFIQENLAE